MNETKLLETEESIRNAQIHSDSKTLASLLSKQLIYVHSNGYIDDYTSYIDKIEKKIIQYQKINIETKSIQIFDGIAIKTSVYRGIALVIDNERKLNNYTTTVWHCNEGNWSLSLFQSTSLE